MHVMWFPFAVPFWLLLSGLLLGQRMWSTAVLVRERSGYTAGCCLAQLLFPSRSRSQSHCRLVGRLPPLKVRSANYAYFVFIEIFMSGNCNCGTLWNMGRRVCLLMVGVSPQGSKIGNKLPMVGWLLEVVWSSWNCLLFPKSRRLQLRFPKVLL